MFQSFKFDMYHHDMPKGRPSDSPRTEFGSRLVELRERKALTQSQVAAQLGISPRAYAFWERKPVALQAGQIARLADIFGVSADLLVGRDAPRPKRNGPKGRLERLFEVASDLPRVQRDKIAAILEPFVKEHASG